jgi:hypothetical protein
MGNILKFYKMVKISVLISVYKNDSPVYFQESLKSIWNDQIHKPNEILLIVDGKITNELKYIIKIFKKKCAIVRVVWLKNNLGLANCLNIGLKLVKYEIVARMDADDISVPERFKIQIDYLTKNKDLSLIGSSIKEFKNYPNDTNTIRTVATSFIEICNIIKYRNPINHPTVMFKKTHIVKVGSYEDIRNFEDYYLWLKLIKAGYFIQNINIPLLYYRIGNGFIKRRIGVNYIKDEIAFLNKVKNEKLINRKAFYYSLIIRFTLRIMPGIYLNYIYSKFLRKKVKN